MTNENKAQAKAQAQEELRAAALPEEEVATATDEAAEEERPEAADITFPLIAEPYPYKGKTCYRYYVPFKGLKPSQIMKAELRPPVISQNQQDVKSYTMLEDIFDIVKEQTGKREYVLTCQRVSSKDALGHRISRMNYSVVYVSEEGITYTVDMVPLAKSDKNMLQSHYEHLLKF